MISLIDLLMWSQATESVTNRTVTSGADVNVSCDLDIEMYCYRHKLPDPPMLILNACKGTQDKTCKLKCSENTNSSMCISNISTDELGVYYCVKTSEPQKLCNITEIYICSELWIFLYCIYFSLFCQRLKLNKD